MCVNKCNVQLSADCWPWISTFILYATMHHHVVHPSHVFKDPKTNPPQEKKGCKNRVVAVVASCFFFFCIVNINIKTKFREPISLGLEAISLTLFASKIHPGRRVASCGELSKMIFSGQLLGTSPGVKCLAGWSWKNSKNNSEMSQGITRRIIHQPELKFVWGSRTELPFPMRSDDVAIVGPDEYVKHDMYCLVLSNLLAASPRVPLQIKVFVVRYSGTLSL